MNAGRFPEEFLDEIRARVPVSKVASRTVRLRKAGKEWKGLTPFGKERTPSFFVNDDKRFFHCFSSGKHGDVFDFVMLTEGLTFPEAVRKMSSEAGLQLPGTRVPSRSDSRENSLRSLLDEAARFYGRCLETPSGTAAREYLAGRGVDAGSISAFGIGYAPASRHSLRDHLVARGATVSELVQAGLAVASQDIPVAYDRFRDRIVFPIRDGDGRLAGFGGRAMNPENPAKYLNSPDGPLFSKGGLLFNLAEAKPSARLADEIVVVEGYLDVVAAWRSGMPNIVSTMGTAIGRAHLLALWSVVRSPVVCFDGDPSGRAAARRAARVALPLLDGERTLRFAFLPEGKDPDDVISGRGGLGEMREVLAAARPIFDVVWASEASAGRIRGPDARASLEGRMRKALSSVSDPSLREHYLAETRLRVAALASAPVTTPTGDVRGSVELEDAFAESSDDEDFERLVEVRRGATGPR